MINYNFLYERAIERLKNQGIDPELLEDINNYVKQLEREADDCLDELTEQQEKFIEVQNALNDISVGLNKFTVI